MFHRTGELLFIVGREQLEFSFGSKVYLFLLCGLITDFRSVKEKVEGLTK